MPEFVVGGRLIQVVNIQYDIARGTLEDLLAVCKEVAVLIDEAVYQGKAYSALTLEVPELLKEAFGVF